MSVIVNQVTCFYSECVNKECMAAMRKAPLSPTMQWEKLRNLTREP